MAAKIMRNTWYKTHDTIQLTLLRPHEDIFLINAHLVGTNEKWYRELK